MSRSPKSTTWTPGSARPSAWPAWARTATRLRAPSPTSRPSSRTSTSPASRAYAPRSCRRTTVKQYKRSERFNKLLLEEVSAIVQRELKDPRIGFVSFTRVETTEDLRSAKFYVSLLDESQAGDTLEALRHASGMIRGLLM